MTPGPLQGELDVFVDGAIEFTFTVTNPARQARELQFRDGLAADFVVYRDGVEVWRWSEGRLFTQALWSEPLAPDESVTYEATWSDPSPGAYEAIARLEAENADVEASTKFTV